MAAPEIPEALTLLACGVIWSGIRLFHARPLSPTAAFSGAVLWPVLCQFPEMPPGSSARLIVGAMFAAAYTFVIEFLAGAQAVLKIASGRRCGAGAACLDLSFARRNGVRRQQDPQSGSRCSCCK